MVDVPHYQSHLILSRRPVCGNGWWSATGWNMSGDIPMKWIPTLIFSTLLASIALGDGLVVTFDPPQDIEAVRAGEVEGGFVATSVGATGKKEFSKVVCVQLKKGVPQAVRGEKMSPPFPAFNLGRAVIASSLVFIWKEGVATCYLQAKDETLRIDLQKEADKGSLTKVDAKEVPASDSFPQFKVPESDSPVFIKPRDAVR
jgi:hypothetical protein